MKRTTQNEHHRDWKMQPLKDMIEVLVGRRGLQITQALDMKNMQGGQTCLRAQVYLIFPMKALGSSSSTTSAIQPLGYKTGRRQLNGVQIAQRTTNQLYDVLELPL
jgi:hypothetical protein